MSDNDVDLFSDAVDEKKSEVVEESAKEESAKEESAMEEESAKEEEEGSEEDVKKNGSKKRKADEMAKSMFDEEAEEASDDEEEEDTKKRKKKMKKNKKAVGSDDEEEDIENTGDEASDAYQADGFVVKDDEDSNEDSDEESDRPKEKKTFRRLKKKRKTEIDEDEKRLIMENLKDFQDEKEKKSPEKHGDKESDDEDGEENNYEFDEEDEMNEFIVADGEEEGDEGEEYGSKKREKFFKPRPKVSRRDRDITGAPTSDQMQEAIELFGDSLAQFLEMTGGDDYNLDDEYQGDEKEPDILKVRRSDRVLSQSGDKYETIRDYDIRDRDLPERFQLKNLRPEGEVITIEDLNTEAMWMLPTLNRPNIPQDVLTSDVAKVLEMLQLCKLEIPFIWKYRKEEYAASNLNLNDLWKIFDLDEKYTQLTSRCTQIQKWVELANIVSNDLKKEAVEAKRKEEMLEAGEDAEMAPVVEAEIAQSELEDLVPPKYFEELGECRDEDSAKALQAFIRNVELSQEVALEVEKRLEIIESKNEDTQKTKLKKSEKRDLFKIARQQNFDEKCRNFAISAQELSFNLQRANSEGLQSFLFSGYKVVKDEPPYNPDWYAGESICMDFGTEEKVIQGFKHVMAKGISLQPYIYEWLEKVTSEKASLDTIITNQGVKVIDELSEYHGIERIRGKPLTAFSTDTYLRILKAEQEGLITVKINIHEDLYFPTLRILYLSNPYAEVLSIWDTFRLEVLQEALKNLIIPSIMESQKKKLEVSALEFVANQCAISLEKMVTVKPHFQNFHNNDDEEASGLYIRVLGICVSSMPKEKASIVILDSRGNVLDQAQILDIKKDETKLRTFCLRYRPEMIVINSGGMSISRQVMMKCKKMCDSIFSDRQYELSRGEEDEDAPKNVLTKVTILKDDVSRIYATSVFASQEFPDYTVPTKLAISMARYIQNPLEELTNLWRCNSAGSPEEFLQLKLYKRQDLVPREMLVKQLERVFINNVNEMGVNINRAAEYDFASGPVQFLCGLGPRKAKQLLTDIQIGTDNVGNVNQDIEVDAAKHNLIAREHLLDRELVGPKVFENLAGFIIIPEQYKELGRSYNPLDHSRIHPEVYDITYWLCKSIKGSREDENEEEEEEEEDDYYDDNEKRQEAKLEHRNKLKTNEVMKNSRKKIELVVRSGDFDSRTVANREIWEGEIDDWLSHVDLSALTIAFQEKKANEGKSKNGETEEGEAYVGAAVDESKIKFTLSENLLRTIIAELRFPFGDYVRSNYTEPSIDDLFLWLSGENAASLYIGQQVLVTIQEVHENFVKTRLDSGLSGYLPRKNLSDSFVEKCDDIVAIGQRLPCKVISIEKERFSVTLSAKQSDIRDTSNPDFNADRWYSDHMYPEELQMRINLKQLEKSHTQPTTTLTKRNITHPNFKHISTSRAKRELADKQIGDVIFLPDYKNRLDKLGMSFKFGDEPTDVVQTSITELDKSISSPDLAQKLKLNKETGAGDEEYEDLDEIIGRYLEPLVSNIHNAKAHRKFLSKNTNDLEDHLISLFNADSRSNHYSISFNDNPQGTFRLSRPHKSSGMVKVRHNIIYVTPNGFRMSGSTTVKPTMEQLIDWFKNVGAKELDKVAPKPQHVPPRQHLPPPPTQPPPPSSAWEDRAERGRGDPRGVGGGHDRPPPPMGRGQHQTEPAWMQSGVHAGSRW